MGDLEKTKEKAEILAHTLPARIFALVGELGAGKTTFAQFFLRALGVSGPITSPTFVIIKKYILPPTLYPQRYALAYHLDCYRLKNPYELQMLGFNDIIHHPQNVVIIEWADRVRDLIPQDALWIAFRHGGNDADRVISYSS